MVFNVYATYSIGKITVEITKLNLTRKNIISRQCNNSTLKFYLLQKKYIYVVDITYTKRYCFSALSFATI